MSENFRNKYKGTTARLQTWDYTWDGSYFITICTADRAHLFGEIENQKMQLSRLGVIADILWNELPHRNPNIKLGEFVVMPNHIHGILILNNTSEPLNPSTTTPIEPTTTNPKNQKMAIISPKPNSISTIIRSYKSAVTKHAYRLEIENGWQPRFYEHIIRNDAAFKRISSYIINNPLQWDKDKFAGKNNESINHQPIDQPQ
ncbi:MAG: transposase [Flavobacteriales bacterium]|nr:transposase [Flavobacteriales bacterium]